MRDGNLIFWIRLIHLKEVLILPMRDGNLSIAKNLRVAKVGSDPTYEGWKPL